MKRCPIIILPVVVTFFFLMSGQSTAGNVIDQLERQVAAPDNPQRVVSLAPSITEIIFALGQEDCLKGVTVYSDFPSEATELPKVGSYIHLDQEKIVALRPDLCIATKDGNPREVVKRLESLKIPVYVVDPRNLDGVIETIIEIGALLRADKKAKDLAWNIRSRIDQVKSLVAKVAYRPKVFYQIGTSPIVSAGTNTFIHELILLAGGKNLAEGSISYPRFSREQVLSLSPDVFIITSMAKDRIFEHVKAEWSRWPDLPAVQNESIFLVDSDLFDRPTPRMIDALELMVRLIHPELFEEKQ